MQRIAVPMIGGMDVVDPAHAVPSIYAVVKGIGLRAPRLAPAAQEV